MREMRCLLNSDGTADAQSVLCSACLRSPANQSKVGWDHNKDFLMRCDGNPNLPCVVCKYQYQPDKVEVIKDDISCYLSEVECLDRTELQRVKEALVRLGDKIFRACQFPGDTVPVALTKILASLQLVCVERKINYLNSDFASETISARIQEELK